jgi:DNA-directed RNA polymerase subunit RPC12/RpoP
MDFYKTIMGHKFYEGTVPRLVRAVEKLVESLDRIEKGRETECPVCGHRTKPRSENE